jgi:hypothetical protein
MANATNQRVILLQPDSNGDYHEVLVDAGGNLAGGASGGVSTVQGPTGSTLTVKFATIVASASGATAVVAAVTGKAILVLSYVLIANAAVNVKFQSAGLDLTGLLYLGANGGAAPGEAAHGHFRTLASQALNINLSAAVAVGGHLSYVEV